MGTIGINAVFFPMAVSKMRTAGNAINGTITSWVSQGEVSTAFTAFAEDFAILQGIISEYKQLVQKDINVISDVGAEMMHVDAELLRLWRFGLGGTR